MNKPAKLAAQLLLLLAIVPMSATHAANPRMDALLWTYEYLLATARSDQEIAPVTDRGEAAMQAAVVASYRREAVSVEFLDTAAEILAKRIDRASDEAGLDLTAWICRLLAERGGVRYASLLERVAATTDDRKLRHHASRKILSAKGVPAESWQPGAISLDAQRAKYPTLYPQSTFVGGHL